MLSPSEIDALRKNKRETAVIVRQQLNAPPAQPVAYRYWKDKFLSWSYADAPLDPEVAKGRQYEPLYTASPDMLAVLTRLAEQIGEINVSLSDARTVKIEVLRLVERARYGAHDGFFKQPGWDHVFAAFVAGARDARANPDADESVFGRAADAYTKLIFSEVDPETHRRIGENDWPAPEREGE